MPTMKIAIRDVVRELNDVLGPTFGASLSGSKDRKLPIRWAKPDGPQPRADAGRRLVFAHRQFHEIAASDGAHAARQWFIGGDPWLGESTPITAIREDNHAAVARCSSVHRRRRRRMSGAGRTCTKTGLRLRRAYL